MTASALLGTFDADWADRRVRADGLRREHAEIMVGWSDLVSRMDYVEIERRSIRLAEINGEIARLGV